MDIPVYDISDIEIPKTRQNKKKNKGKTINVKLNGVRPCIMSALGKDLSGEQGNKMRVAIVREYHSFGMTDKEQLIALFSGQSDFTYEKTSYYVDKILERDFRPWPQQTLLERCSKYLNCDGCDRFDCKGGN